MIQPLKDTSSIVDNKRIDEIEKITSPKTLIEKYPLDENTANFVELSRNAISNIINFKNDKLLVITWPCSIHNVDEALEYAELLKSIKEDNPHLFLVMRTYFEKPRTTVWWKWLLNDPYLDDSCEIDDWLHVARELLLKINKMWIPTAVEFLDTITPQYIWDLVSWWAIWARTTESQEHRKLVSWLSMPVWFKNGTSWDIQIAIDAIKSSKWKHTFLSVTKNWEVAKVTTTWNQDWHIILRWWSSWPNYYQEDIEKTTKILEKNQIKTWIIVDASHGNSNKNYKNQPIVSKDIAEQIVRWNKKIVWIMIEWNLNEWNQPLSDDLLPWVSITDACVNWETNKEMISELNEAKKSKKS